CTGLTAPLQCITILVIIATPSSVVSINIWLTEPSINPNGPSPRTNAWGYPERFLKPLYTTPLTLVFSTHRAKNLIPSTEKYDYLPRPGLRIRKRGLMFI